MEESRLAMSTEELSNYSTLDSDLYEGSFAGILDLPPHLGALEPHNVCCSATSLTIYYNDSFMHSLPIILNSITSNLLG